MKKIVLFLLILLGLQLTFFVKAIEKIPECCILKRDFTDIDANCAKGNVVGPPGTMGDDCYGSPINAETEAWGVCCLFNSVYTISTWVMTALVTVSILIGAFGGWLIATSGGNPAQLDKGKNYILYAIVGIIIGLVARGIPGLVRLLMKG